MPAIERSGLKITDIEILRLHYAETLKAWRERFMAHRDEAKALYDEKFCRIWEFYLASSESAFRWQNLVIFQFQIAHDQEAVPLTRDYIQTAENCLKPTSSRSSRRRSVVPARGCRVGRSDQRLIKRPYLSMRAFLFYFCTSRIAIPSQSKHGEMANVIHHLSRPVDIVHKLTE
jgi:hypothetical protein